MLFWILLAIAACVALGVLIWGWHWESFGFGIFTGILSLLLGGLVAVAITGVLSIWVPKEVVATSTSEYELQAVATGSETSGRFYLLGGYFSEEPSFRYLRAEGDGFVLRSAAASDSIVYQGDYSPRVEVWTYTFGRPWLEPFTSSSNVYMFYVPEGSVSNDIKVEP